MNLPTINLRRGRNKGETAAAANGVREGVGFDDHM